MDHINWQINKDPLTCAKYMLDHEINCDVNFKVGEDPEHIKAHKFILSMRSPVFDRMFNGGFQESQKDPVIPDTTAATFRTLLRYCYYECLDFNEEVALSVLYAAKKYMLPVLEEAVRQILIQTLGGSNVWEVYSYSRRFGDANLSEICTKYFKGNIKPVKKALQSDEFLNIGHEVLLAFLNINATVDEAMSQGKGKVANFGISITEVELFKACNVWAEAECRRLGMDLTGANKRAVLGQGLFLLRFPTMLQKDLANVVYPIGILTQYEMVNLCQYKNQDPGSEYHAGFPTGERCFLTTTAEGSRSYARTKGTVSVDLEERLILSKIWVTYSGHYRVTIKERRSQRSWSMKVDSKKDQNIAAAKRLRTLRNYLDIGPHVMEPRTRYYITARRSEPHSQSRRHTTFYTVYAPFKEVRVIQKESNTKIMILALTFSLV